MIAGKSQLTNCRLRYECRRLIVEFLLVLLLPLPLLMPLVLVPLVVPVPVPVLLLLQVLATLPLVLRA